MLISAKYAWYIILFAALLAIINDRKRWKTYVVALMLPTVLIHGGLVYLVNSGAVIGGDVRRQLGSVVVLRVQEREHLNLHGVGTVVVGASRIKAGDLIGRADGDGVASCGATVLHAAAGGQGSQSRDRSQSGDNFLAIHYGILSFLSESPLCKAI